MSGLSTGRNMLWNAAGSFVDMGCQWLITVLVVRLSSSYDAAGVFSLVVSVYGIFSPIAQYRMHVYQLSDVSNENTPGEYFAFRLITCAVSLFACAVYAAVLYDFYTVFLILLYGVYMCVRTLSLVYYAVDQHNRRMDYVGRSLMVRGILNLICFAVPFWLTQSLAFAITGMIVSTALMMLLYDLPKAKQFEKFLVRIDRSKILYLASVGVPLVLASMASSGAVAIPKQYSFEILGEGALGVYASISAPVAIIQLSAQYIYSPLMTRFAELYQCNDGAGFKSLLLKVSALIALASLLCLAFLLIFGEPLMVLLFGESISGYTYLIPLVASSAIAFAYMGLLNDLLITVRCFSGVLFGGLMTFVVACISCFPLVNSNGLNGLSISLIVASFVSVVGTLLFASVKLKGSGNG